MFWRKASHSDKETESAEKDAKVRELRAAIGALTGRSLKFCNDACIRLYLEARNWDVEQAKKMLEETLKWRSTYKPEEIRWHEVAHEGETGKASISNFHDRQGRTILRDGRTLLMQGALAPPKIFVVSVIYNIYTLFGPPQNICSSQYLEPPKFILSKANFTPKSLLFSAKGETSKPFFMAFYPLFQNTSSAEGQARHLVYLMEKAIMNLPEGQEQMTWLVDFNGWSLRKSVPIKTARDITYLLQNHYPERLALVVLYSPPGIFETFWKIVKYFVDPKTFQKIRFVYPNNQDSMEVMKTFFDSENLPREFGGKTTLKYDHEEFSRLMTREDVKTAKFWGFDDVHCHDAKDHLSNVEPEPVCIAQPEN